MKVHDLAPTPEAEPASQAAFNQRKKKGEVGQRAAATWDLAVAIAPSPSLIAQMFLFISGSFLLVQERSSTFGTKFWIVRAGLEAH